MSRLTFRETAEGTCYQKQLRDQYDAPPPKGVDLDLKTAVVRAVSHKTAKQIILQYEWLGTMPVYVSHYYGIFFGLHCAGVACFGVGVGGSASPQVYKEWVDDPDTFAYLARGACVYWSPPNTNSKLISVACKLLRKELGTKIVVAYADTDAGEIGTIYQACNWVCVGQGSSLREWISPAGAIRNEKLPADLARKNGGNRQQWIQKLKDDGWKTQMSNPKYRYVYILDKGDKELVRRVEEKRVDYPKRAAEAIG